MSLVAACDLRVIDPMPQPAATAWIEPVGRPGGHGENAASWAALLGMGATFEGIFRDQMVMPDGELRHSAWYSIVREECPR